MIDPRFDDVHDGHGNYLAEVERELPWVSLRRYTDLALGVLAAWTVAYWVYLLAWPDRGIEQLFAGIGLAILGFFGTIFFGSLLSDITLPSRNRRLLSAMFVVVFVTGVAVPMATREKAEDRTEALNVQKDDAFRQSQAGARLKWIDDVYAAGAHGPLGAEPPMLVVVDDGATVQVRNISHLTIRCVHIVRRLPGGGGGVILRTGREDCVRLAPGASSTYSSREERPAYQHGPLEFRIGDQNDPEPSWWSDTALQTHYPGGIAR